jgi:tripartite ATP-independent transporter DctM subunit
VLAATGAMNETLMLGCLAAAWNLRPTTRSDSAYTRRRPQVHVPQHTAPRSRHGRSEGAQFRRRRELWSARWRSLAPVWPLVLLVLGMIGGLYGGLFTPTEAGAAGAFLACVIALAQKRLDLPLMRDSVLEAVRTTAQLFFVAYGAVMYTRFPALAGMPDMMTGLVGSWSADPVLLLIAISVIYLILGMFVDPLGILLLTLPIVQPMFDALGLDPIWLGVIVVKYIEIGLLTPPVGFNAYVVKSAVGNTVPLATIFRGIGWLLACEIVIMALILAFPQISLWLPGRMN